MSSERYTEAYEIERDFPELDTDNGVCGSVVYCKGKHIYVDPSEAHILVDGRTGMGKSLCVSTTYAINCLLCSENIVVIDPKGEIHERTIHIARKKHKVIVINFRDPEFSKDCWNPLFSPYCNYNKSNPKCKDLADSQITDTAFCLFSLNENADPFWDEAARTLFSGLVRGLFEKGDKSEITLDSIACMCEMSEETLNGSTLIKHFADQFDPTSIVRRQLSSYVNAPKDTRGSIHSVFANGISIFGRNNGLIKLLSNDTIDIEHLDVDEQPLALYIIIPDEVQTYDQLAALLIKQLLTHFIRLAYDKYNGHLPRRLNVILEEMSIIGKSIPDLDRVLSAGRSRNIRMMLVTQNAQSQLSDIYGKSKAEAILSCIGITYAFSNNSLEAMTNYSNRCGYRYTYDYGFNKDLLISPTHLSAMSRFTALVLIENKYKYIYKFPSYFEIFPQNENTELNDPPKATKETSPHHVFNLKKFVEKKLEADRDKMFLDMGLFGKPETNPPPFFSAPERDINETELMKMIETIDVDDDDDDIDLEHPSLLDPHSLDKLIDTIDKEISNVNAEKKRKDPTPTVSIKNDVAQRIKYCIWVSSRSEFISHKKLSDSSIEKIVKSIHHKYYKLPKTVRDSIISDINDKIDKQGYETRNELEHALWLVKDVGQNTFTFAKAVSEFFKISIYEALIKCSLDDFYLGFISEEATLDAQKRLMESSIKSQYYVA